MISILKPTLVLLCMASLQTHFANALEWSNRNRNIEVPLEELLVPYYGFDNTNNLEITLHGNLPNPCYRLAKVKVEKHTSANVFTIHQYAVKKSDGVCAEENAMPVHMNMRVPFTNVVSLGAKKSGNYTFSYMGENHQTRQKTINIREAQKTTIDDYPYAAVSAAMMSDVVMKNEKFEVTLSGVFTSSCAYLDKESVRTEKQGDVYVVLPVIKMKAHTLCTQSLVPFVHKLEMDAPEKSGHYLVHVRSMNGKSVNHVVEALD